MNISEEHTDCNATVLTLSQQLAHSSMCRICFILLCAVTDIIQYNGLMCSGVLCVRVIHLFYIVFYLVTAVHKLWLYACLNRILNRDQRMITDAHTDVCDRDCIVFPEISRSKLFLSFEASTQEGFVRHQQISEQNTDDWTVFYIIQMHNFKQINWSGHQLSTTAAPILTFCRTNTVISHNRPPKCT